jgi:hypothetical protein
VYELNRIAYESETYWGYDLEYMKRFEEVYSVSEDYVRTNPTFVLSEGNAIIGFYSLSVQGKETELELFYIDPDT